MGAVTGDKKYYYDLTTGEVDCEKKTTWTSRMGPYDSAEEARHALEIARQHTKDAEEYDRDGGWNDDK